MTPFPRRCLAALALLAAPALSPAAVFVSADDKWMDYLAGKGKIDHASPAELLRNELVLIAPKGKGVKVRFDTDFDFAAALPGKLCTGETGSVPAGIYAKEALTGLSWWRAVQPRIVGTDDVRAALDLVGRGECFGIVYATDAKTSDKVDVVGTFPAGLHSRIVYPAALVSQTPEAAAFFQYLKSADKVFAKHGFKPMQ